MEIDRCDVGEDHAVCRIVAQVCPIDPRHAAAFESDLDARDMGGWVKVDIDDLPDHLSVRFIDLGAKKCRAWQSIQAPAAGGVVLRLPPFRRLLAVKVIVIDPSVIETDLVFVLPPLVAVRGQRLPVALSCDCIVAPDLDSGLTSGGEAAFMHHSVVERACLCALALCGVWMMVVPH